MKMSRLLSASSLLTLVLIAGCGGGGTSLSTAGFSSVNGRVVNESNQPVSGAQVSLLSMAGSRADVVETTLTDGVGSFHLTNVDAGTYTLVVRAAGPGGTSIEVQVAVTVPAGSDVDIQIRIIRGGTGSGTGTIPPLATAGSIVGKVFDHLGRPAVGFTVTAQNMATGEVIQTTTDAYGVFQFNGLEPGMWSLTAHSGSGTSVLTESVPFNVNVTANTLVQTDIYMPAQSLPPGTTPGTGGSGSLNIPGNGHAQGHIIGIGHSHHGNGNGNGHDKHDHDGDGDIDDDD